MQMRLWYGSPNVCDDVVRGKRERVCVFFSSGDMVYGGQREKELEETQ